MKPVVFYLNLKRSVKALFLRFGSRISELQEFIFEPN